MNGVACKLCGSVSVQAFRVRERMYVRCRDCDLIVVPDEFHVSPQDEMARYRLHENTLSNEGYVRMFREKIALIKGYCPGIRSVLDYGCGPQPVLAELLRREGYSADAYDPYFFPEKPDEAYDLVMSTEVFEHFRDVRAGINGIRECVKDGGFLAVMTAFHDAVADFNSWWYITDPTHICFYGMRTFGRISREFGFSIVFTDRKNFIILRKR
ncbi:MAG TPA: class I SAM-dependent methyltransferase [Candidatus Methanoperedenaceae archaeon]|nr:class I SAM-dependent methyltransferase [Candidatus Methanoperedenaceae archaeon]